MAVELSWKLWPLRPQPYNESSAMCGAKRRSSRALLPEEIAMGVFLPGAFADGLARTMTEMGKSHTRTRWPKRGRSVNHNHTPYRWA